MASAAAAPRYAPEDPTLPKPWKGLVDGKTGYLYFWNPDTNVTQYERPVASSHTGSAPHKSSAAHISSSVQVQQSSQGQRRKSGYNDDDDRYSRGSNGGLKPASGTRSYQVFLLLLFAKLSCLFSCFVIRVVQWCCNAVASVTQVASFCDRFKYMNPSTCWMFSVESWMMILALGFRSLILLGLGC
ncbi:hypothetical protein CsSME_00005024 [Camellia sinensis var. sinensis]